MDSFGNIGSEWNRRMSNRMPWRGPGFPMYQPMHTPMMGLFRQPPPAHLSETMYVAERTGQKVTHTPPPNPTGRGNRDSDRHSLAVLEKLAKYGLLGNMEKTVNSDNYK